MTTLLTDKPRRYVPFGTDIEEYPVVATDVIYEGAAIGDNASGYARPLVSGDRFLGFAEVRADNSVGSAGAIRVRSKIEGVMRAAIASLAITDVGRPVYADDDDTFVLDGLGSYVGRVCRYDSSGVGLIAFNARLPERHTVVSLPINLASVSAADVLTTYTPGFWGRIKAIDFAVTVPVTTGGDLATLNAEIGTTNLTGGTVALTSAAATPLGKIIAGAAITAGNVFGPTDTISIEASAVTAFAEGAGVLLIKLGF